MAGSRTRDPQRGSPRVQSWVYEAINAVLEALRSEISLLERNHVTWQFWSGGLGYILPIEEYLSEKGREILDDFVEENPDAQAPFREHDELVAKLASAAKRSYASLLEQEAFGKKVHDSLAEYLRTEPGAEHPRGAVQESDFPKLVAEHVVNSVDDLPSHYTDSKFWARFGEDFRRLGSGTTFEDLRHGREALLGHDRELVRWLRHTRSDLCRRYDIPVARSTASAPQGR